MPTRSRAKADKKQAEREARRAAIAAQYGSAKEPSSPPKLGRAMFLRKSEMKQYVGAGGKLPEPRPTDEQKKLLEKGEQLLERVQESKG